MVDGRVGGKVRRRCDDEKQHCDAADATSGVAGSGWFVRFG